jgi:hypothetical protein
VKKMLETRGMDRSKLAGTQQPSRLESDACSFIYMARTQVEKKRNN